MPTLPQGLRVPRYIGELLTGLFSRSISRWANYGYLISSMMASTTFYRASSTSAVVLHISSSADMGITNILHYSSSSTLVRMANLWWALNAATVTPASSSATVSARRTLRVRRPPPAAAAAAAENSALTLAISGARPRTRSLDGLEARSPAVDLTGLDGAGLFDGEPWALAAPPPSGCRAPPSSRSPRSLLRS